MKIELLEKETVNLANENNKFFFQAKHIDKKVCKGINC